MLRSAYFALLATLWRLHDTHCYAALALWPVLSYLSFIGATTTHNAMHCPLFYKRRANQVFQTVLSLTYGHPVSTYVPGHNLSHHKFTQLRQDVMRTTKLRYKWHFLNGLLFQSSIVSATVKSDLKYLKIQQKLGRPFFDQAMREFFWLLVVQFTLVFLDWRKCLIYWLVPHNIAQWAIVTINLLQHDGCEVLDPENDTPDRENPWKTHPNTARDFTGSWLNFLTNNNGYHSIHHQHPEMHWSKLPEAHAREIQPYQHENLRQASILGFIFRTFVWPGKREMYDGRPVEFRYPDGEPDAEWIKLPKGIDPKDVESSFAGDFRFLANAMLLVLCKLVAPSWSPEPEKSLL